MRLLVALVAVVAVLGIGLDPRAARADEEVAVATSLSAETNELWEKLDEQCVVLADQTEAQLDALRSAKPAYVPIVDFCQHGTYPAALVGTGAQRDRAVKAAFAAGSSPLSTGALPGLGADGVVASAGGIGDALIRGLAVVLMKRAKAELQGFIVDTIRDRVCGKDSGKKFLANTCAYLGDSETFGVTLGPALRSAVVADVAAIPQVIMLDLDAKGTVEALSARLVITTVVAVVERVDLRGLAVRYAGLAKAWACADSEATCVRLQAAIAAAGKVLGAAVELGQLAATMNQPPSAADLARLATFLKTAIGAHYPTALDDGLVLELRDAVLTSIAEVKAWNAADAGARREDLGQMIRSVLRVVDLTLQVGEAVTGTPADRRIAQLLRFAREATLLVDAVASADLGAVFTLVVTQLRRFPAPEGLDDAIRVLALGVELAAAKTPEEVEATIETVAAPMGSYRRKFHAASRAITGLVGFSGSLEIVHGSENPSSYGPIGLVGVDLSWPVWKGALVPGVFISVLDLGSVFADQEDAGAADPAPIRLEQVTALGLHGRLGSKHVGPVVLHGGVAWIPNYRDVAGEATDVKRVTIGLSVDVTLWGF